jgi:hypothetical protein
MLRMVYRRFQTKNSLSQFYDYSDLQKVTLRNDSMLEAFLQEWRLKLNGLEKPEMLPSAARLEMFVRQLKSSALLKYDMDVYKRADDPDADRAYATLVRNVEAIIREQRNARVQSQLGQGGVPPAMPAPAGTVCRYYTAGSCQKGDHCDMIHDDVAKKAHASSARASAKGGDKGGGKGGGLKGGPAAAKGGEKGLPKKQDPGPHGRNVNTKGGVANSRLPCYANYEGRCKDANCKLNHRSLTALEVPVFEAWKVKAASRAASPGAPAPGVCPEFLAGNCALGAQCSMEHPKQTGAQKRAAKAKAKAGADL